MTDISLSQQAIVALVTENAATISASQIAIVAVCWEPPFAKIIPPLALPGYTFSGIPFYIQRGKD